MTSDELIENVERLIKLASSCGSDIDKFRYVYYQATELLRQFAGKDSRFYIGAVDAGGEFSDRKATALSNVLRGFVDYIKVGLFQEISPERKAQLDVVSDLLDQANTLLNDKSVHPAAPAVLIGATLEEFLRTWVESLSLSLGNRKPTIDSYAHVLYDATNIDKQDLKDITSWAGIRNSAAHGEWANVESREKVSLMLQGVNLFLRKYGA